MRRGAPRHSDLWRVYSQGGCSPFGLFEALSVYRLRRRLLHRKRFWLPLDAGSAGKAAKNARRSRATSWITTSCSAWRISGGWPLMCKSKRVRSKLFPNSPLDVVVMYQYACQDDSSDACNPFLDVQPISAAAWSIIRTRQWQTSKTRQKGSASMPISCRCNLNLFFTIIFFPLR